MNLSIGARIEASCPRRLRPLWDRVRQSKIGYRMARGAFWLVIGSVFARALTLLGTIAVARILGKSAFGSIGMVQQTIGMFAGLAGLGLSITSLKYVAEHRTSDPTRAGKVIALGSLVALATGLTATTLIVAMAPSLAEGALAGDEAMEMLLLIAAPTALFVALSAAQNGALSGFEEFRAVTRIGFITGPIGFVLMVAGALALGVQGVVMAATLVAAVTWLLGFLTLRSVAARHGVPVAYVGCHSELPILWNASIPAVIAENILAPVNWLAAVALVNQPDGYAQMGVFNAANQWRAILWYLPTLIAQTLTPVLSNTFHARDRFRTNYILTKVTVVAMTIVIPMSVLFIFLSRQLAWLYGPSFVEGYATFLWLISAVTIHMLGSFMVIGLQTSGRMWIWSGMSLVYSLVYLALSMTFVEPLGATALSLAAAVASAVSMGAVFVILWRDLPKQMQTVYWSGLALVLLFTLAGLSAPEWLAPLLAAPASALAGFAAWTCFGPSYRSASKALCDYAAGTTGVPDPGALWTGADEVSRV